MGDRLGALILTNRRAGRVITDRSLRECGYTGPIYYVVDDLDPELEQYRQRYGDRVLVFDKLEWAAKCDAGNNTGQLGSILFARNAAPELARSVGLTHCWQLDDDYPSFHWAVDLRGRYLDAVASSRIRNLDSVLAAFVQFLETSQAATVCFSQGGDFIGGAAGAWAAAAAGGVLKRKAMKSFLSAVDRPVRFVGIFNEDVNTYTTEGQRGQLFVTVARCRLQQKATQSQTGGITELYRDGGTYRKSFTTVMYAPSCVQVRQMGYRTPRVHHAVQWRYTVPKILRDVPAAGGSN